MIPALASVTITGYHKLRATLKEQRIKALAATEKEIDRLSLAIGTALMAEPTSRDPQYADFKHHLHVAERDLARQKNLRLKLKRKLER